jgi:hypothetical protein
MTKKFDALLKHLVEAYPSAWVAGAGWPTDAVVRVIDADVSTVSGGADTVLRVETASPWLLHLEMQTGPDTSLLDRSNVYNTLLGHRYGLPVRTVLVLLHRKADLPRFTGLLEQLDPNGNWYRRFRYQVVRVWQMPVEGVLTGPVGLLPLAPISDVEEGQLPEVVRRMDERLAAVPPALRAELWTSAGLLMGLRFPKAFIVHLLKGVPGMGLEESTTIEWFLEKGEARGYKKTLLWQGTDRFGPPEPAQQAAINALTEDDLEKLEKLVKRVSHVHSWDELLHTP